MKTLNTFEIITNKNEVNIYSKPYNGDWEALKKMRDEYPNLVFYKSKDYNLNNDFIYCWSLRDDYSTLPKDFKSINIDSQNNPTVWCSMLENSFVSLMKSRGREVYKRKYSHIWELVLNSDTSSFNGIGIREKPILKFSFQFLNSENTGKIIYFVSIRKVYKPILTFNDDEYSENNIDTRLWKRNREGVIISNRQNIKSLLQATGQNNRYINHRTIIDSEVDEFQNLNFFHTKFKTVRSKYSLPDNLIIKDFLFTNLPNSNFKTVIIKKPQYYFYNESTGTGFYNQRVKELRPSSYDVFKDGEVKVLFITPSEYEGTVGSFSTKLIHTLRDTFHIPNISQKVITFNHKAAYAYSSLLKELNVDGFDIVVHILSLNDKKKEISRSPYFQFKAKLINQKTPSQKILIETIRKSNRQILDAIALNIYTKIGGTAWTIEKDQKDKSEVIIGISSTVDFNQRRVMGFASVIDYRGKFLTGECTQLSDINDYSANLEKHLINIIERIITSKNIQKGEEFRLIFHLTKSAGKKNEIKAIGNALKKYQDYEIQIGIIHLSYSHNYKIYKDRGSNPVERGTYIRISENQALLHLGTPTKTPILIRRDNRSTYKDIEDMSKHALHFAHLSHRSYRPSSKPVTILYPAIMAKLVSELKQVSDWDKDMIDKLNGVPWFI